MRSMLILRLVDITLLLLLSLMAAATIEPEYAEPPVSREMESLGHVARPLRVAITAEGEILVPEAGAATLPELAALLAGGEAPVEFIADRGAPATLLLACHRAARRAGRSAVFLIKRHSP